MSLNAVKMLGISITSSSKREILEEVRKYLSQASSGDGQASRKTKKPLVIVTPNPEQIVYAEKDPRFAKILNQADIKLPDGIGVIWASRFFALTHRHVDTSTLRCTIPGVEFMGDLVALAAKQGYPIALIGGRGEVAVRALECLQQKHPGLVGWALEPGEIKLDQFDKLGQFAKEIAKKIRTTETRLVFVGLGAPKQEYVIARLARQFSISNFQFPIVLMAVGGSFDILSGRTPRAPRAIQAAHLEWLWRLGAQPWRWKRQLALPQFIWLVFLQKFQL